MFAIALLVGAFCLTQFIRRVFVTKEDLEDVDTLHQKLNNEIDKLKKEKKTNLIKETIDDFNSQIFQLCNIDKNKYTIDLHGLYPENAIKELTKRINQLIAEKYKGRLTVITGRGLHSVGEPKIKPKVKLLFEKNGLKHEEVSRGGAFYVSLKSRNILIEL
ncbi:hypothetical protein RB653_000459 [Dictyostelium firmibasis]|uniref:Smr domain-containing protein n=1 Tax=Dictyostelium firmibasis TaxID=79012 RepID=A0AAN7TWP4_9MYCE